MLHGRRDCRELIQILGLKLADPNHEAGRPELLAPARRRHWPCLARLGRRGRARPLNAYPDRLSLNSRQPIEINVQARTFGLL